MPNIIKLERFLLNKNTMVLLMQTLQYAIDVHPA
jgi:hypothetical protein